MNRETNDIRNMIMTQEETGNFSNKNRVILSKSGEILIHGDMAGICLKNAGGKINRFFTTGLERDFKDLIFYCRSHDLSMFYDAEGIFIKPDKRGGILEKIREKVLRKKTDKINILFMKNGVLAETDVLIDYAKFINTKNMLKDILNVYKDEE
jgi:hypothetical protein